MREPINYLLVFIDNETMHVFEAGIYGEDSGSITHDTNRVTVAEVWRETRPTLIRIVKQTFPTLTRVMREGWDQ